MPLGYDDLECKHGIWVDSETYIPNEQYDYPDDDDDDEGVRKMKSRSDSKKYKSESYREPKYPTDGRHQWWCEGYVQAVRQYDKGECFYCDIWEKRKGSRWCENFQLTIPYDLDCEPEEGDYIRAEGRFRSWTKTDGIKLELVVTRIEADEDKCKGDTIQPKQTPSKNACMKPTEGDGEMSQYMRENFDRCAELRRHWLEKG